MFRIFAMFITLFISASVFSEQDTNNLSLQFANTIAFSSSDKVNSHDNLSAITPLSEAENTPLAPLSENHSKSISFAQPIRASLLTDKLEQTPEYVLLYELLSAQLDVFANNESALAQAPPAWFMVFSDSSSRLSGWKDSNSLYTSKVTYHLS